MRALTIWCLGTRNFTSTGVDLQWTHLNYQNHFCEKQWRACLNINCKSLLVETIQHLGIIHFISIRTDWMWRQVPPTRNSNFLLPSLGWEDPDGPGAALAEWNQSSIRQPQGELLQNLAHGYLLADTFICSCSLALQRDGLWEEWAAIKPSAWYQPIMRKHLMKL